MHVFVETYLESSIFLLLVIHMILWDKKTARHVSNVTAEKDCIFCTRLEIGTTIQSASRKQHLKTVVKFWWHILLPAVNWHNLATKALFVLVKVPRISFC